MKKKLALLLAVVLVFTFCFTACGKTEAPAPAPAPEATDDATDAEEPAVEPASIVWANYGSSKMPIAKGDAEAIKYMEESGLFKVDYQCDGVLGGEADMIQQIMDGTIEATILSSSTFSSFSPLLDCLQLPFLIGDYETERKALESPEAQALYDAIEADLGIKIIGYGENGIRHFATKTKPINNLADIKGVKLRIVPSNMLTEVMTNLGAAPMSVAYAEVYSALQNNVIDGEEINITSIYAMSHYEQLSYISEIGMYPFPSFVCVNADFWNSLSAEQQQVWLDAEKISQDHEFNVALPDFEKEARKACEDAGIEFNTIEGADREAFVEIAKSTWTTYSDKDPLIAAFIDAVAAM